MLGMAIGLYSRAHFIPYSNALLLFSFAGIIMWNLIELVTEINKWRTLNLPVLLKIFQVVASIQLSLIYLIYSFDTIVGWSILLLYLIILAVFYLKKSSQSPERVAISIFHMALILMFIGFKISPQVRQVIPSNWFTTLRLKGSHSGDFVIEFKNNDALKYRDMGRDLLNHSYYSDAIKLFKTAMALEPNNALLYYDLSQCYAHLENLDYAIAMLDTAILCNNQISEFYSNRGLYYYKKANSIEAIKNYRIAINLDSLNCYYHYNLALALYDTEDFESACKSLEKSRDLGFNVKDYLTRKIDKMCK
ncbi:Tetratricopeptide repeat-containing protein [Saccharicrinis carchari]|uniref:Tetratricopeptide repeat-containing protein n=2 Tax=Saccharicrinis carchari TaxID=1168039 RepID=A0A521F9C9_SACCC|nr:Tetratricopeptide repeat-containing protein [Saccharicrinis carchari]